VIAGAPWDHVGLAKSLAADEAQPHAAVGGIEPLTNGRGDVGWKVYREPVVVHWIIVQDRLGNGNHRRVRR